MQEAMSYSLSGIIEDSSVGLRGEEGQELLPYLFLLLRNVYIWFQWNLASYKN